MNFSTQQIDVITQAVLREIKSRRSATVPAQPANADVTAAVVTEKVITEETLATANAAGRSVTIPCGAIITPSGHDYIRRNGVTVASSNGTGNSANTNRLGLLISIGECSAALSAAKTAKWTTVAAGCEVEAARKAKNDHSGPIVCCGGEPSMTACLLNRDPSRRAAVITKTTNIERLNSVMSPDIICLDATAWAFSEMLRLFRQLETSCQSPPAKWQEIEGVLR